MSRNKHPEETVKLILDEAVKLFVTKSYDKTSIQDIINNLGGLSKGAIYHHFKSKEEIFNAACSKLAEENSAFYAAIRDDKTKNGREKLKAMLESAYTNPNNDAVMAMIDKVMSDAKFFMNQIRENNELVVPVYIEPIIREGVADGSIKTDYPKELASLFLVLINLWINPIMDKSTSQDMLRKLELFQQVLRGIDIDILDDVIIAQYVVFCERYNLWKQR